MNKKKILVLAMTLSMVAILAIGGTIAYFTAEDEAVNTFTVGNVKIDLTEPKWDEQGKGEAPEAYPGEALAKDPTIENIGKNPCFVRVKVEGLDCLTGVGADMITYKTDYVEGKLGTDWVLHTDGYFYYTKPLVVKGTEGDSWNEGLVSKTDALFDQIVIPSDVENGDAQTEYNVIVKAEAVQAQGAKAPNWAAVKGMTVEEIAAWFTTCMPPQSAQ